MPAGIGTAQHWSTIRIGDDAHIGPMDERDKTDHLPVRECWCGPEVNERKTVSGKKWNAIIHNGGPTNPNQN